ncbi:MAG: PD-(D/E)XK nuclease family protein [Longimicrobiales bacterium]
MGQDHSSAKRTFVPWTEPLLGAAARILTARYRQEDRVDLSRVLLVLPGGRAGRRLLEILAVTAEDAGLILVPPHGRILTPGALPEHLYDPHHLPRATATDTAARRAWALAVEQTGEDLLRAVFPHSASFSGLGGRTALAGLLDSLNRTLGGAGLTFSEVARECGKGLLYSDEERWEALSRIQSTFWQVLREGDLMDREAARRLAVREGLVASPGEIVLVGVVEMPEILCKMLRSLSAGVEAFVHAPEALSDYFDALGLVQPELWAEREIPVGDNLLVLADRPGDQASAVLRILSEVGENLAPEDITIGVPDEAVVPFLEQRMGAYGIPVRYAGGFPLRRTGPYRFLEAAGNYLATGTFRAFAELIRHPIFQDRPGWLPGPEEADAHFRRHLPHGFRSGDLPPEASGGAMASALETLHGPNLLGPLRGRKSLSAWMRSILDLVSEAFGDMDPASNTPEDRRATEACLRIRDRARSIHDLPPCLDEICTPPEAIRVLLGEMEGDALPPEALEEAVELVGWLELHLDDAPALFLTGVNEGSLPGNVDVDPFLPNGLRARLGVGDNGFRFGRDAYLLTAIIHSRQGPVRVVAGRRSAGGEPLRPSRLLLTGGGPEVAGRVLLFAREEASPDMVARMEPLAVLPADASGFQVPPEPSLPLTELPRPLPVTAFRSLLSDPYLWVLERILRLEEVSDDVHELDPLAFGSLAHRVLETFGRSREAASGDFRAVVARLDAILDQLSKNVFGTAALPSVPLQVAQLRSRLHSFARWQAAWAGRGWRILAVEARTVPEGAPFPVDGEPAFLSGRIDRIDVHEETGEWVIFDYKTGETAEPPEKTHRNRSGWKDLQLPLYRHLLRHLDGLDLPDSTSGAGEAVHHLAYLPLARKEEAFSPAFATWTPEDLADADETAREVIRRLRRDREVRFQGGTTRSLARGAMATLLGRGALQEEGIEEDSVSGGEAE